MSDSAASIPFGYRLMARLPLRMRRKAVRMLFALKTVGGLGGRWRRTGGAGSVHVFQRVLRLSRQEAIHLDREAIVHDLSSEVEWLALNARSHRGIRADMRRIRIRDPEILDRVAASRRPVILAPLHMGAYVIGLAHTMLRFFPGRRLLILRQRDDQVMETRVLERIREFGVEMRFLNVTKRADFLSAVRFARDGAVIVVFCDLPASYGTPTPMPMFGMPFVFAFGIDSLARLTGATVVPWNTVMEPGGDTIRIGRPFEIEGNGDGERAGAIAIMRDHIRESLRDRPEQWHLWSTLADYLPADETVQSNPVDAAGGTHRDAA